MLDFVDCKRTATMPTVIHAMSGCADCAGRDDQDQNEGDNPRRCLPEEIEHLIVARPWFRAFVAPNVYDSVSTGADGDSQIANLRLSERQAADATRQSCFGTVLNWRLGSGWEAAKPQN